MKLFIYCARVLYFVGMKYFTRFYLFTHLNWVMKQNWTIFAARKYLLTQLFEKLSGWNRVQRQDQLAKKLQRKKHEK